MLFTDGLIERRGESLTRGMDELMRVVRHANSAEDACASAMAALVPPVGLDDDVAVVAVRSTVIPAELRIELRADPSVLAAKRA